MLKQALAIKQETGNLIEMPYNLKMLVHCFIELEQPGQAVKYAKRALAHSKKLKSTSTLAFSLDALAKAHEAAGDFKNALKTTRELMALNEKTQNENDQKRMAEMETKYRAEKNEIILKETKAKSRIVQKSLKEKEVLLKEIHHRVKNNLQLISSLINLQAHKTDDETTLEALHEGRSRVKAMALICLLYTSPSPRD